MPLRNLTRQEELDLLWKDKGENMENEIVAAQSQLPQAVQQDTMLTMIERICSNPNFNVSALQELRAMREADIQRQEIRAFIEAMEAAQKDMPKIVKNRRNTQTNSNYADLEGVDDAAKPVYLKHGFTLTFGTAECPVPGYKRITCDVLHKAGHIKNYFYDLPLDATGLKGNANKTEVHAHGSTTSYGRRYLTCLIFNIATTDDKDGNKSENDLASTSQRQAIQNLYEKLKEEHKKKFVEEFGVAVEVRKMDVDRAMARLNNTINGYGAKNATNNKL